MTVPAITLAVIIGLLLAETRVSRAHERRLQTRGAIRPEGDPYLALKLLYPAAFLIMGVEGLWRPGERRRHVRDGPRGSPPAW